MIKTFISLIAPFIISLTVSTSKTTDILYLPFVLLLKDQLPIYKLQIESKDYQFLLNNLPDYPRETVLTDKHKKTVPATFIDDEQQYPVKVRFRGGVDHWRRPKKSLKIQFKNGNGLKENHELNFIIPEERGYIDEHFAYYLARQMGLISPYSWYGRLYINGKYEGVYFIIEHLNEDFLQKNIATESAIFAEDIVTNNLLYDSAKYWKILAGKSDFTPLNQLINLVNSESDEVFFLEIENLVDMDNFLTWQAHSMLMGNYHQDNSQNNRLVYNNDISKFQFIPNDVTQEEIEVNLNQDYNKLVTRILKKEAYQNQRNEIIKKYLNTAEYVNFYQKTYQKIRSAIYKDRKKRFSNIMFNYGIYKRINMLKSRHQILNGKL